MVLSDSQLVQYERDGYVTPIPVLSKGEAQKLRGQLQEAGPADGDFRTSTKITCNLAGVRESLPHQR